MFLIWDYFHELAFNCQYFQFFVSFFSVLGEDFEDLFSFKKSFTKNFLVISILSLASDSYTFDSDPIFE